MFSLINKAKSMEMSVKPIEPCKWKQKEIQQKKSQKGKLKRNKKCMFAIKIQKTQKSGQKENSTIEESWKEFKKNVVKVFLKI